MPTSFTQKTGLSHVGAICHWNKSRLSKWSAGCEQPGWRMGPKPIKCVMSALFSHAVRWEFCGHNPISSGIPVGSGGKRGPSTGVRISAKRQKSPLVLSPEEVILGLAQLEFRDQLLVFLDGALGIRQGELGALRWLSCDFENMSISVQHSY